MKAQNFVKFIYVWSLPLLECWHIPGDANVAFFSVTVLSLSHVCSHRTFILDCSKAKQEKECVKCDRLAYESSGGKMDAFCYLRIEQEQSIFGLFHQVEENPEDRARTKIEQLYIIGFCSTRTLMTRGQGEGSVGSVACELPMKMDANAQMDFFLAFAALRP